MCVVPFNTISFYNKIVEREKILCVLSGSFSYPGEPLNTSQKSCLKTTILVECGI